MKGVVCPSANYPPMKWIRLPVSKKSQLVIIIIYGKKSSCSSPLVCPIYINTQLES